MGPGFYFNMTTMTDNTTKQGEAPTEEQPKTGKTIDISPSEKLKEECGGCRLSFSWATTSRKVDDNSKADMATSVHSTSQGFSASKRLMDSKHDAMKKANELRNRVSSFWYSMTLPLAAASMSGDAKLEGGTRLIKKEDVADFHKKMQAFKSEAVTVSQNVTDNLEDIKAMDKDRLGDLYNEADYPTEVNLTFSWGFPNIEVPSYLEELAPEVYAQERNMVRKQFEDTYELAMTTMFGEFEAVLSSWVDRLGPVVRVYPPDHAPADYIKFRDAEVLEKVTHNKDDSIPTGQVKILLRYKPAANGKGPSKDEWVGPIPETYYNDIFKPSGTMAEKKTFRESTIQNLADLVNKFSRLGDTISSSDQFKGMIKSMQDQLAKCSDTGQMTKELRDSQVFRAETHKLAQKLSAQLDDEVKTFKKRRRVTRQTAA